MRQIKLDDDQHKFVLPIDGLEFQPNTYFKSTQRGVSKLASSKGPLVSDFVTHQSDFKYDAYGIHIGQDDRLTFFGYSQEIVGYFIDCREHSKTFGLKLSVKYKSSSERRLIIPRGVAHSFDNLQGIVTRDEPVWYSDFHNPDWEINNDLISLSRDIALKDLPRVKPNSYLLPDEAHHLFSRIQQELLQEARRYSKRERLESSSNQYRVEENSKWNDVASDYQKWLTLPIKIPGIEFRKNNYALTGSKSYTVVPSNDSCLADVIALTPSPHKKPFWLHYRQRVSLTFLAPEMSNVTVDVCDLRPQSPSRLITRLEIVCDPRVRLVIPQGIAYRIIGNQTCHIRFETELFVDEHEPRMDIPLLGHDTVDIAEQEIASIPARPMPDRICPKEALHLLAREEIKNFLASCHFRSGE